jgi:limonene 1,2-monooxygenase
MESAPPLRFGLFLAPHHPANENPTYSLERDLQLIQHVENLGFDEVWIGEHHSAGWEYISSPEVYIAHAAARTSRIKLGTGMVSLPYHHPFMSLQRIVLLDHLTRGRVMFGMGPGSLPTDAEMIGLEPGVLRPRLEEAVDAIVALLRSDEPVNMKTDWFTLKDAVLQLQPYSHPCFDMAVAAIVSPVGPRIAGKHGLSLVSIGATMQGGFDALGMHWNVVEEEAAHYGTAVDRQGWRLVGPMHVAETKAQAYRDVEHGIAEWFWFMRDVSAVPQFKVSGKTVNECIEFIVESGAGVIGTVDDACEQIARLQEQSGGFGCYMVMGNSWANPVATKRSFELIAQHVMPEFQGSNKSMLRAVDRALAKHDAAYAKQEVALSEMKARHERERLARQS